MLSLISDRKKLFRMIIPCFPAFNIYSSVAKHTTALGPVLIATIVSKMDDWEVEVIDENNYLKHAPKNKDGRPDHAALQQIRPADAVGFYGGLTSTIPRLYELARFYKGQRIITLAGGQHFINDNIREGLDNKIDFIVIGEGEKSIKELLEALCRKENTEKIMGIAFYRDGELVATPLREEMTTELDRLPLPDFSLLRHSRVKLYPVSWVRGCGMKCEFCTVKGNVRYPSPDYIFDQFASLFERLNATYFFIVDDLFGQNRQDTLDLCRRLKEYQELMDVNFFITAQIRLDKAKDIELLRAMREANIKVVAIGYESPIAEELEAMHKKLKPDEMVKLTGVFHKIGFLVHGMFIFGYPAKEGQEPLTISAEEHVKIYWKFIKKARIDTIQILSPVPLPGTEMTERLAKAGRVFSKDVIGWEYYDGNFPLFTPDAPLTANDMLMSLKKLMGRFYGFRYMFCIGLNILFFPMIIFSLFNLKIGWRRWYKSWRNNIWRFAGWTILKKWSSGYNKNPFAAKLEHIENMNSEKHQN